MFAPSSVTEDVLALGRESESFFLLFGQYLTY